MDQMEIEDSKHMTKKLTMKGLITEVELHRRKPPSRRFSVCLGLMCALLLVGNIGQILYNHMFIHPISADLIQAGAAEKLQLEATLTNLTEDKDQLQKSYNTLKQEKDQLQTNYSNMQKSSDELQREKHELQRNYSSLETSYTDLNQSKYQLQSRYQSLSRDKDELEQSYNDLRRNNEQLQTNYSSLETIRGGLTRERDQIEQSYSILKQEKDQLQSNYEGMQRNLTNLQREKHELKTQFNEVRTNRDELQRSISALKSDKDQLQRSKDNLQSRYNTLQREKDQLRTDYNSLTAVRDQLQQRVNRMDRACPSGWNKFGESCFYVSYKSRSWSSSRDFCNSKGGHLAILNSRDKMRFFEGFLESYTHAWIGLTDRVSEGTWRWVDQTWPSTTFWGSGQPDDYNSGEDCGEIRKEGSAVDWNDNDCNVERFCICEKAL
ncbi:C-type lectin domain family 10 member A-like [Cheilinus undulatus]|uniref:C-type lectin domain family 10 member A-like n=1 Tax=Cheilinus undulatus TaxID=241271 RepID=UPI001BD5352E|nr:C-type lectin domain family 10 member A-like [Cheilinus undulatus]